jgi:hypothetical protein
LEEAMNNGAEILSFVLIEAKKFGDELAPTELLNTLLKHSEPINALSNMDQCNEIFEALRIQFGFLDFISETNQHLSTEENNKLVALLRWLIREFQDWQKEGDNSYHKLTALFVVSQYYCDLDNTFWSQFPAELENNLRLINALEELIGKYSINFTARSSETVPIWEKEAVDKFQQANSQGDWLCLADMWQQFEDVVVPSIFCEQTIQCQYQFGFDSLIKASSGIQHIVTAVQITKTLTIIQRLKLALASDNPYIQFASVYQTVSHRYEKKHLTNEEQQLLTQLLVKIAKDESLWVQWMKVFNRYPLRYPEMQVPLGQALAIAPYPAIKEYVNAIGISTISHNSRLHVSECLRSFRSISELERQNYLWELAYHRWSEWQFEEADLDKCLFEVAFSELDYAVVGYIVNCMTESERDEVINAIYDKLDGLQNIWFTSHTDYQTEFNRLLSRLQPYLYARSMNNTSEDWLLIEKQYYPFDPKENRYVVMMSGMRGL